MHMPKSLLPVSALTLSLLAGSATAKDTETEAQLREALRQKLAETTTNQPAAAVAAPAPAPAATAPAATPTAPPPAVRPIAVPATAPVARVATAATAAVAPAWADDPETAKLREALRQRLEQEAVNPTPVMAATPEPTHAPVKPTPEEPAQVKPAPPKPAPAASTAGSKSSAYPPLAPPDLPISASKQERLAELLNQYKADLITPAEYHAQRAKIIAE